MKSIGVAPRAIALALCVVLGLPIPAFSLRIQATSEASGLEELTVAFTGLEELPEQVRSSLVSQFLLYHRLLQAKAQTISADPSLGFNYKFRSWAGFRLEEGEPLQFLVDPETGLRLVDVRMDQAVRVPVEPGYPLPPVSYGHYNCCAFLAHAWNPQMRKHELIQWHFPPGLYGPAFGSGKLNVLRKHAPELLRGLQHARILISYEEDPLWNIREDPHSNPQEIRQEWNQKLGLSEGNGILSVTVIPHGTGTAEVGISTMATHEGVGLLVHDRNGIKEVDSHRIQRDLLNPATFHVFAWDDLRDGILPTLTLPPSDDSSELTKGGIVGLPAGLEENTLESRVEEMARRTSAGDPTVTPEEVEKLLRAYYPGRVRTALNAFEAHLAQARATLANDPARFREEGYETLQRVVSLKDIQPAKVTFFQTLELLSQQVAAPEQALATPDLEKGLSQVKDEAARARLLRQKVGLPSPHDLEKEAGLSWSVVSRLEQGKRGIGPYARQKLRDFFQKQLGVSLTLSFEILWLPLEKSVNRFKTTDERFSFVLHDLLGWSYARLVRLANTLRTADEPSILPDEFRAASFNSARPGKRRLLRNALEKALADELKYPVTLDGHLRVVTSSISDSLKALPNSEKRLAWLLEGVLIWSKNELLRRAHIVSHDVVEPPQSKSAQSMEKWRKIQHALEEGIAARGEKLSLGVDLLPQSGLEEEVPSDEEVEKVIRQAWGEVETPGEILKAIDQIQKWQLSRKTAQALRKWRPDFMAVILNNAASYNQAEKYIANRTLQELAERGITPAVLGLPDQPTGSELFRMKSLLLRLREKRAPEEFLALGIGARTVLVKHAMRQVIRNEGAEIDGKFVWEAELPRISGEMVAQAIFDDGISPDEAQELLLLLEGIDRVQADNIRSELGISDAGVEEKKIEEAIKALEALRQPFTREYDQRITQAVEFLRGGDIRKAQEIVGEQIREITTFHRISEDRPLVKRWKTVLALLHELERSRGQDQGGLEEENPLDERIDQAKELLEQGQVRDAVLEVFRTLEYIALEGRVGGVFFSRWKEASKILREADSQIRLNDAFPPLSPFVSFLEGVPRVMGGDRVRQNSDVQEVIEEGFIEYLSAMFEAYRQVHYGLFPSQFLPLYWDGNFQTGLEGPAAGLEESSKTGFELSPIPDQAVIEGNRRYLESKGWEDRLSALPYDRPFILEDRKLQVTLERAIRQQEAQLTAMKAFQQLAGPLAELLGIKSGNLPEDAETSPERSVADNLLSFSHFLQALHLSSVGQDTEAAVAYQAARETAQRGGLITMFGTSASSDALYVLGRFYLDTAIDVPRAGYVLQRGLASFDMDKESQFIPEDFAIKLGAIDLLTNPKKTGVQIIGETLTASHGYASQRFQVLASGDDDVARGLRAHFAEVKKQTLAASALVNQSGMGIVLGAGRFVVFPLVELLRERLPNGSFKYNKFLLVELGADISKQELDRMVEAGEITAEEAGRVEILPVDATGILEGATGYIDKAMADAFQQEPRKVPLDKLTILYKALADPRLINRLVPPGRELMVPENSVNFAVFAMAIQDFASPIRKYIDTWLELFPVDRETKEALEKLDEYSGAIQKNITAVILRRLPREVVPGGVVFLGDMTGMVSGKGAEQKKINFYDADSLVGLVPAGLPFEAANPASWLRPNNTGRPDLFFVVESMALKKAESAAPTANAGLEESIPLVPGVTTKKLIFITPEMASPQLFESLKTFKPAPGEQLPLVVFAEHDFHVEEIQGWLNLAGLRALEIVNVKRQLEGHKDWDLFDVVAAKQAEYYLGTGVDIHTIWFFEDLKGLGRFLGVAPIHVQLWEKSLERQYGTQA